MAVSVNLRGSSEDRKVENEPSLIGAWSQYTIWGLVGERKTGVRSVWAGGQIITGYATRCLEVPFLQYNQKHFWKKCKLSSILAMFRSFKTKLVILESGYTITFVGLAHL